MAIFVEIAETTKSDAPLKALFSRARECAEIYLLVAKRQKGCDGMGELAMVKEEFRDALYELTDYCRRKGYGAGDILYEIDVAADELAGLTIQG